MVPSILGMTGALARQGGGVAIVTPTPCRLADTPVPEGVSLLDGETDLAGAVQGSQVVHIHGLWQGHARRGARAARRADIPYLISAHGMAEPWALLHKALKKRIYTAARRGEEPPRRGVPPGYVAPPRSAIFARWPQRRRSH